jgi:hypothetical protein
VWDGSDSLGRRYDGTFVGLPDVAVRHGGRRLHSLRAQLRLSLLGNHYVRFEADLAGASPAEVYALTLRAAPESGSEELAFEAMAAPGAAPECWPRLPDLAVRLAEDVCERLGGPEEGVHVITRPGMFRLVVSVNAASVVRRRGGRSEVRELRSAGELAGVVGGAVLTNPVAFMVVSMADWIRYSPDHGLARQVRLLVDEWVVCTSNTTLVAGLGAPLWTVGTKMSVAEFAASLEGLFAGWSSELAGHYHSAQRLQERLPDIGETGRMTTGELRGLADDLEREKIRLHDFALETRSTVGLIRSPSLVSSPVAASMMCLLLEWSDFGQRVAELEATVEQVLDERLAMSIEKLAHQRLEQERAEEARTQRRQRAKLDTILAVIAAIGVSGLGQIVQGGYGIEGVHALELVAGIVVLAVVVGVFIWRSGDDPPRGGPGGG